MKKLLLIVNPKSGKQQAKKKLCDIIDTFIKYDYEVSVHITQMSKDAQKVAAERGAEFDLIVCCGGDGTLNETSSGLMMLDPHRPPIGYIPFGSTNDFASTLELSGDIKNNIETIVNGKEYEIDIGKINDRYFNYIASIGAFTSTSYTAPQSLKNSLGHLAYVAEGLKDLPNIKPFHAKIKIDDNLFEDDYIFAAVCNTTSIAGIVKLDRELVDLGDGMFEIILVRNPKNALELSKLAFTLTSREYDEEYITFIRSKEAVFRFDFPISWSVDGEYFNGGNTVKIENKSRAIKLIR